MDLMDISYDEKMRLALAKTHNDRHPMHILPPELWALIFTVGTDEVEWFHFRAYYRQTLPDLITVLRHPKKVCSHWRHIAINTPALWKYIYITRPLPQNLNSLYIARAGTEPLEVSIEIRTRYLDRLRNTTQAPPDAVVEMYRIFEYLVLQGAGPSRWQMLTVCAKRPEPLFRVLSMINAWAAPNLRFLCLQWKVGNNVGLREELESQKYAYVLNQLGALSSLSPSLRYLELASVPLHFALNHPLLFGGGLTRIELTAACSIDFFSGFEAMLSSNPKLESLSVGSGFAASRELNYTIRPTHIPMDYLRSLTLRTSMHAHWMIYILQAIRAPILRKLTLSNRAVSDSETAELVKYIVTGSTGGPNYSIGTRNFRFKPIFPSLDELDICELTIHYVDLRCLLSAFPWLPRIAMSAGQAEILGEAPWLLPSLNYLDFPHIPFHLLGNLCSIREEAGFPIRTVDLLRGRWEDDVDELPDSVDPEEHEQPDYLEDHDDSDPEDEGKVEAVKRWSIARHEEMDYTTDEGEDD